LLPNFYPSAYAFDQSVWDLVASQGLAGLQVDPKIHRHRGYYLESDIRRLWAQWFIEGVVDPIGLIEKYNQPLIMDVLKEVHAALESTFNVPINISWPETCRQISEALLRRVEQINSMEKRKNFNMGDRRLLLTQAGSNPRCWICGDKFEDEAVALFKREAAVIKLPTYVDIFRPKGLNKRHLGIEIDHMFPLTKGGGHDITNFRLCCGWCNIHKKDRTSLYEVGGAPTRLKEGVITRTTAIRTIPVFFWTVRAMGLLQRCEHENCNATASNASLRISLIEKAGAATPSNLKVVCEDHDEYNSSRLHLAQDVQMALPGG
jgi:hypothetical protein